MCEGKAKLGKIQGTRLETFRGDPNFKTHVDQTVPDEK
jgi:hypothetical protein